MGRCIRVSRRSQRATRNTNVQGRERGHLEGEPALFAALRLGDHRRCARERKAALGFKAGGPHGAGDGHRVAQDGVVVELLQDCSGDALTPAQQVAVALRHKVLRLALALVVVLFSCEGGDGGEEEEEEGEEESGAVDHAGGHGEGAADGLGGCLE